MTCLNLYFLFSSVAPDYTIPEGVLENFSVMEIVTLRRQVRISIRSIYKRIYKRNHH